MPTLQADDVLDVVSTTLRNLGRFKISDLSTDLQKFPAAKRLLRKKRVRFGDPGYGMQWSVMVDTTGAAAWRGLYEPITPNQVDVVKTANVPWRHCNTHWVFEERLVTMNQGSARIFDTVKAQRLAAMIDYMKLMEETFWEKPASSSDEKKPFGVPYWHVKATSTDEGFNGGNPSGFSSGAGNLDSGTYTRWANYNTQYTDVTKDDLIRKMRKASEFTHFIPAVEMPTYDRGPMFDYGIYTNYDVYGPCVDLVQAQNQNLGTDLAKYQTGIMFMGVPMMWVPVLNDDTQDPVYGINWSNFAPAFCADEYFKQTGPFRHPDQHRSIRTHIDSTLNYINYNRRTGWVINKA